MRKILTILLVAFTIVVSAQTPSYLYVKVGTIEHTLSCDLEEVFVNITRRKMFISSSKVTIDAVVKHRKVGNYNSAIIYDEKVDTYYFVTPIRIETHFGLIFSPCEKNGSIRNDAAMIILSTYDLCK